MEFPSSLTPNPITRAGRMLAAGDVRVTVTVIHDCLGTGEHITVRFKAYLDTRKDTAHERNWTRVPYAQATHVFVEVPNASGEWADKIGTFYPRNGKFYIDKAADPERVQAAAEAATWLNGEMTDVTQRDDDTEIQFREESRCGVCGRELTDPVSIDRGIGPECFGKATGSQHQVKQSDNETIAEARAEAIKQSHGRALEREPGPAFDAGDTRQQAHTARLLDELAGMPEDEVAIIRRELNMWESQGRQTLFGA